MTTAVRRLAAARRRANPSRRGHQPRLVLAVAAVTALIAGCSTTSIDATTKNVRTTGGETLKKECSTSLCTGQRGGANFVIKTPAKNAWNGTLIIWSHGYRNAGPIPVNPLDPTAGTEPVDTSAEASPSDDVSNDLIGKGYALAGSAFKSNGWDVTDAVSADQDLYQYFGATFGKPKRVYIWGASLGGLITQTLAETHAPWISGVAPLCGVLGGTNLNLDLALDVAYAVKTLIYPQLTLTGFASQQDAVANWVAASKAVADKAANGGAQGIADLLAIAAISGAPSKTENFDGHDATSVGQAYAEAIITALGYGTWGRYDIEQRAGGNPSQNTGVDYGARIDTQARSLIDAAAPGQLAPLLSKLAAGTRVSADPAARQKADSYGDPQGDLAVPTITLHTLDDPLVLSQNESVFASRVSTHTSAQGSLVQMFTAPPTTYQKAPYGAGHCNFTKTELEGVVTLLDNWVRGGVYAGPGAVAQVLNYGIDTSSGASNTPATEAAGTATTGYQPNESAGPWPAATGSG